MDLQNKMADLSAQWSLSRTSSSLPSVECDDVVSHPPGTISVGSSEPIVANDLSMRNPAPCRYDDHDHRKSNLVMFGIQECNNGLNRQSRLLSDINSVVTALVKVDDTFQTNDIQDCFRLGKFSNNRSRPILFKLNQAWKVKSIFSNRFNTHADGIFIQPDMSPDESAVRSLH